MALGKTAGANGYCDFCSKLSYVSRKAARKVARNHATHKSVYPCPLNDPVAGVRLGIEYNFFPLFHVGGLALPIRQGHVTRGEFYGGDSA
jgi:hypothetical protein